MKRVSSSISNPVGGYARIGNLVYFETGLTWSAKNGATTGNLSLNLPVGPVSSRAVFQIGYVTGVFFNRQLGVLGNTDSTMNLCDLPTTLGAPPTILTDTNCANTGEIQITGTYRWR